MKKSGNEETRQPTPPAPKRRRTRKTRAATSTRVRIIEYPVREKEPGFEIFAESKELDNDYLVTPQAAIAIWKATSSTACLKPQYLYIRIGKVDLEKCNQSFILTTTCWTSG